MRSLVSRVGKNRTIWRGGALCAGAATLLIVLLAVCAGTATPAGAAAEYLRVPGDADTIQAAVDLAESGTEIRVQGGEYSEHVVITKSVRLSGSWNADFSLQDTQSPTILKGGSSGRVVTVFTVDVTPTVVMSYLVIMQGSASGLGGAVTPTVGLAGNSAAATTAATTAAAARAATPQAPATVEQLRANLVALAAAGKLPGGEQALEQLLSRLDAAAAPAAVTGEVTGEASVVVGSDLNSGVNARAVDEIDCGGGIYVRDAYLHLLLVNVSSNVASSTGTGAGGGICAVNLPAGGLQLERATIANNTASETGYGYGGGLFYSGGETPAAGAVALSNVRLQSNRASGTGRGYGGGAFVTHAPGGTFDLTMLSDNYATYRGLTGNGGGIYLADSAEVHFSLVGFEGNTATNSASVDDPNEYAVGVGGGMYAINSPRLLITSPPQSDERSLFVGNLGVLRGVGDGGALYIQDSPSLRIERTDFTNNWALFSEEGESDFEGGGAIFCSACDGARIVSSKFANNAVALFSMQGSKLSGGAVSVGGTRNIAFLADHFEGNTTGPSSSGGLANGGAVAIAQSTAVTVNNSVFQYNIADTGPIGGLGGALHFKDLHILLVEQNTFIHNRAGTTAGIGGALVLEREGIGANGWPEAFAGAQTGAQAAAQNVSGLSVNEQVTINSNLFLDNEATANQEAQLVALGGALAVNGTNGLELTNNLLAGNSARNGAAMALIGWDKQAYGGAVANAAVTNNTLFNNAGNSGVYAEIWTTPLTFTNNIFANHTVAVRVATNEKLGGMTAGASYNLYDANGADSEVDPDSTLEQTNKIAGAPGFIEPWKNDFHLLPTSIAIDAGDPAGVPPAPPSDFDLVPRPFGTHVDLGAYEWHGPLNYLPSISWGGCETLPRAGWAIGVGQAPSASVILHTTDGVTWARQYTSTVTLSGLAVVNAQKLWVTGDQRTILHSVDGGITWQKQPVPAALPADTTINNITAVDDKTAWATATVTSESGNTGYVLGTNNGGTTWTIQGQVPSGNGWINWISAADAGNIWFGGGTTASLAGSASGQTADAVGPGYIYHSGDGGRSWQLQFSAESGPVIGIDAVSPKIAWAAGRSAVYRTLDGGQSWQTYPVFMFDANHVDSIGGEFVWAAGDNFVVMYTSAGMAQPLPESAWQERTPKALNSKVAYTVDFVDTMNGWIAGGRFSNDAGGVVARTCDGGINWRESRWEDLDPIRTIQMVP